MTSTENRNRQIVRVQKIHQKIRDMITDFGHKVSTAIAKHYGTVVIEDLNVQGMQRNHHPAKSMSMPIIPLPLCISSSDS